MNRKLLELIEKIKKSFSYKYPELSLELDGFFSNARFTFVLQYRIADPNPNHIVNSESGVIHVGYTHVEDEETFDNVMSQLSERAELLLGQNSDKPRTFDELKDLVQNMLDTGLITKDDVQKLIYKLNVEVEDENKNN